MFSNARISGNALTGAYSVECSCGARWSGEALRFGLVYFDPALPVAESAGHFHEAHTTSACTVAFAADFRDWLLQYWELASRAIARGADQALNTSGHAH